MRKRRQASSAGMVWSGKARKLELFLLLIFPVMSLETVKGE